LFLGYVRKLIYLRAIGRWWNNESQVGQFPGIQELRRRTVRQPVNPMDRATVVSIYPKDIEEVKHTIEPGRFRIKAGSIETPTSSSCRT
jgi:hypothetical protein